MPPAAWWPKVLAGVGGKKAGGFHQPLYLQQPL
jgi:hypothetical protein